MKPFTLALWAAGLTAALTVGCASLPPPTAKVASSAAAIRAAEELRVTDDAPAAQLRFQYAKDEYDSGQKAMAAGDQDKAERLFSRAEADAELAVAITKQVRSEKAAFAAQAEVQKVNSK